jgi:hypothetical protein
MSGEYRSQDQGQDFLRAGDTQSGSRMAGTSGLSSSLGTSSLGTSGMYGGRSYSGVGPKNYSRSDERITEDLCERLTQDYDIDASEIEVKAEGGVVTLEGTVEQRWMKHRAEDIADSLSGVRQVENRIRVQSGSRSGSDYGASGYGKSTQTRGQSGSTGLGSSGSGLGSSGSSGSTGSTPTSGSTPH